MAEEGGGMVAEMAEARAAEETMAVVTVAVVVAGTAVVSEDGEGKRRWWRRWRWW